MGIVNAKAQRRHAAAQPANTALQPVQAHLADRLLGKPREIRLALACVLAGGHLLIDDVPGVGKTTLAHALAEAFALDFSRIQFTSDVLPADILGVSILDRGGADFRFRPGPIFADLILADEINRANPRTQSALLEAMAERQVTVEGQTRRLSETFTVIATQNAVDHSGTFVLPDSQLDRFLMRIHLGYPDPSAERQLLARERAPAEPAPPLVGDRLSLTDWRQHVAGVSMSDALVDYLLALLADSRDDPAFVQGLSPRAGLALQRAAQAWAVLDGRDFVLPEDLQAVLPSVVDHRLAFRQHVDQPASTLLLGRVPLR